MKVIGIGDNVVDQYCHTRMRYPGGNALNFSVYAAMQGAEAAYAGVFGSDDAARHVMRALTRRRVDTSRCLQVAGENGCASLTIERGERIFLGSNRGGIRQSTPMDFILDDMAYLTGFELMHTSSYSYIDALLPALSRLPGRLSYDFSDDFDERRALALCRWLDFAFFSCAERSDEETRRLLRAAGQAGCRYAIATRGAEGAILSDGDSWLSQRPQPIEAVDTLGAGDAFISAFLLAFLRTGQRPAGLADCLRRGAQFAAEICLQEGAFGCGERY